MKTNLLTISFVGVFKTPQTMIQPLDAQFCKNVFHSPENTVSGFAPAGFIIRHRTLPAPLINISPEKIIIIANSQPELLGYIKALKSEIASYEYCAYGLNRDVECLDICNGDIGEWINRQFINNRLHLGQKINRCSKLNIMFDINEGEFLNIDLEPRAGIANGLFLSINHHNNYGITGFPEESELNEMYESSGKKVNEYIKILTNE